MALMSCPPAHLSIHTHSKRKFLGSPGLSLSYNQPFLTNPRCFHELQIPHRITVFELSAEQPANFSPVFKCQMFHRKIEDQKTNRRQRRTKSTYISIMSIQSFRPVISWQKNCFFESLNYLANRPQSFPAVMLLVIVPQVSHRAQLRTELCKFLIFFSCHI